MTSQLRFLDPPAKRIDADATDQVNHGEVFTRRWVVEFILDLVGYEPEADLASRTIVEPACGTGAFLIPIVDRLVESCRQRGTDIALAGGAIRAFDVLDGNADLARKAVTHRLGEHGLDDGHSAALATEWVRTADFLLRDHEPDSADYVVGNPPYVRLEDVPRHLTAAYRQACPTMLGRSDIYVGFIEMGLGVLHSDGSLGFICADRWMHNQYGAALRDLVTSRYAVDTIVSMHDVDAFEDEVSAYPAIIVLRNGTQSDVTVVDAGRDFGRTETRGITAWARDGSTTISQGSASGTRLSTWFRGTPSWPAGNPARQQLVAELEARFPPLETADTGTRVGIGVATGCDEVYITRDTSVVEEDRLLPLLTSRDTTTGRVEWSGTYLVNPWKDGSLVDLDAYPRLNAYMRAKEHRLRDRHVARRRPESWFRTIDRVDPSLQGRDKLVLPDIKAKANPVLDGGRLYPHHNLYFVVSEAWDLEVLGGILLSDVANALIGAYCVKMRGGCYRFQAQYLRRMRLPRLRDVDRAMQDGLASAFRTRDRDAATEYAAAAFGLDQSLVRAALGT